MEIVISPAFTVKQKQSQAGRERVKQIRAMATPAKATDAKAAKIRKLETGRYPLNPLRENFVHEYLLTGNAIKTYKAVYETTDKLGNPISRGILNFRCGRLMQSKQIVNRIAHLQERLVEKNLTSREQLTQHCIQALEKAKRAGNGELMLKAVDRLAKLHGLNQDANKAEQVAIGLNINLGYTEVEIKRLNNQVDNG